VIPVAPVWAEFPMPEYPRDPRARLRVDTAVIGGGLAGLSAAYHLLGRRPGARLVLLEARRIGAGASGRTTGLLGPGVGQSLAGLVRRWGPARARALYVATLRAVEDVGRLVARERIDCELAMTGQLVVARSPAGRDRLAAQGRLLRRLDLPGDVLDDEVLERLIRLPHARGGEARGPAALRLPVAGTLHPTKLLAGLARRVTERGGTILEESRVAAVGRGRPVRLELAGGGEVLAEEVVVSTAGYTPDLGLLRGRILPVHLQVVATEPLERGARTALGWNGREGILDARQVFSYFRLTADDRIVFGGGLPRYRWGGRTDDDPHAPAALDSLARELDETFGPQLQIRVARGWTGVIGYVLDTLPVIGRARGRPSVLHAVGWCGHGIGLSVASGAWIARMLCDGAAPEDLPWYRDRPPLLPFEPVRWAGFQTGLRLRSLLDRMP
jgi:gamma-glutamylputrescine oxidase